MKYEPEEDSDPALLEGRALDLMSLYESSGQRATLDEAVVQLRASLALTAEDHPDRAGRLSNLGNALHMLFERTGESDVLAETVSVVRAAVAASAEDPDRSKYLSNLGIVLHEMFGRTGQVELLIEAAEVGRAALDATEVWDAQGRAATQNNLAFTLIALYERTGRSAALREAVEHARAVVATTTAEDRGRGTFLGTLGTALIMLFRYGGDEQVLEEATETARQAVAVTSEGRPELHKHLGILGWALRLSFERTGQLDALVEAVDVQRRLLGVLFQGSPYRAGYINDLGIMLLGVAERTGDPDTLAEALGCMRTAVELTAEGHPSRAGYLNNLGSVLRELSNRSARLDVLIEAVSVTRAAVKETPADDPRRALYLGNLGGRLRTLAERTGQQDVAAEAVEIARAAVKATPEGRPALTRRLNLLGHALQVWSELTGRKPALAEARQVFREAASNEAGETFLRIVAYRQLVRLAADVGDAQDGLACVEAAIDLVDQLAPARLVRADREHQLGRVAEIASDAAAAALDAEQPERAVELLERTRGILAADTFGLRGDDLNRLREKHPEMAAQVDLARQRIDTLDRLASAAESNAAVAGLPMSLTEKDRQLGAQRSEAHSVWQSLLDAIRALPGFADFFRAPRIATLVQHAHAGPVVYVTVSDRRADALILTDGPEPVVVVPLPGLTASAVDEYLARLVEANRTVVVRDLSPAPRPDAQDEVLAVLAWLWDTVAQPVLARLGYTGTPADGVPLPRIWWCPVGAMTFLPLHAAGHHRSGVGAAMAACSVLDVVVSSYTSTVRALPHKGDARSETAASSALIVPVPDLPGAELPGVLAETAAIKALAPDARVLDAPTRDVVLDALPSHRIAHFACHGRFDPRKPARSTLVLTDHATAPLTLADIRDLHIDAELAYLSACDTATSTRRMADESLHITGAFHLAGYRNVVGTLWSIGDAAASAIAQDFYSHLTDDGLIAPDTTRVAYALHYAVNRLRASDPSLPSLWAAHTHTGG